MTHKTYVIAEAGVNHNGDIKLAKQLIDVAVEAGADAVKFQTFKADLLVTKDTPKAGYQALNTGIDDGQYAMLKSLELSEQDHFELYQHCLAKGVAFMSTPFDVDSLHFLRQFQMPFLKVPSGEITNALLLWHAGRSGMPIILSTGMATLSDIDFALAVILFGRNNEQMPVSSQDILRYRSEAYNQGVVLDHVTLLHCTTEYPTPLSQINLRAMQHLQQSFGLPVGYSDHSQSVLVPAAAVAAGAVCIEKHFTISREMSGPDHAASMEPDELKQMIVMIRETEQALGLQVKFPQPAEFATQQIARQRLVAKTPVKSGDLFTLENLTTARSPKGISASEFWTLLGQVAEKDYELMEPVCQSLNR
jgi:N-acetylneuraminate synthase